MSTLDKKLAFLHVIDGHRWLAASGCAWNLIGPGGPNNGKFDHDLPNIDVMVRDCLLLHARSLIKFYRSKQKAEDEDIVLSDFCIPAIPRTLDADLEKYERPIEVHLLHLTDWRDLGYRNKKKSNWGNTHRPNWDQETSIISKRLIDECLKHASDKGGNWQAPFIKLYEATVARYRDKSYGWPKELGEKADVQQYLKSPGL
jgi:hypothetical protein